MKKNVFGILRDYTVITASTFLIAVGIYFFKFPNNFTFGGVSGLSVVLGKVTPITPATANFVLNIALVVLGFAFLGRSFTVKTVYASVALSVFVSVLEKLCPLSRPVTDEPMLDLIFAVVLPSLGSAILFNMGASSGGTDIIAMIVQKHTGADVGRALFISDVLITLSAFLVFNIKTALFSCLGLMMKTVVIDGAIENINLRKYISVICTDPAPICAFITKGLDRSATVFEAKGAYSHSRKYVILTAMKRFQALQLRHFIRRKEPGAFILITNTSEIIGKGFHNE